MRFVFDYKGTGKFSIILTAQFIRKPTEGFSNSYLSTVAWERAKCMDDGSLFLLRFECRS